MLLELTRWLEQLQSLFGLFNYLTFRAILGALSQAAADAFGDGARGFASHAQLAETLSVELRDGVRVLVKGSRGSAMDRIVKALLASDAAADKAATHKGDADAA